MDKRFCVIVIAGVHGQEPQSSSLLEAVSKDFTLVDKEPYQVFSYTQKDLEIYSIPKFNEYGLLNKTRGNKNKVDLNRNFPSANWSEKFSHEDYNPGPNAVSEVETQKMVSLINNLKPNLIISIHTNHFVTEANPPQVNFDGEPDSKGHHQAKKLSELIDLECTLDIGYSTPGSLGSYAKDIGIPCITLELDDTLNDQETLDRYSEALIKYLFDTLRI